MSGGMRNISVSDCDFTNTGNGLNIKYSAYRGGYVQGVRYRNIVMGNISRSALTIDSGYGSINPSCAHPAKMPVPVLDVSYTNITQAPNTECAYLIDFKGLPTNTISGVALEGIHLKFRSSVKTCEMVSGTYRDAPGADECKRLKPARRPRGA